MGSLALFGGLATVIIALLAGFGACATIKVVQRVSGWSPMPSCLVGALVWAVLASLLLTLSMKQAAAPTPSFPHESDLVKSLIVPFVCIVGPAGALLGAALFAIGNRRTRRRMQS